jgi:chitin-binding protein
MRRAIAYPLVALGAVTSTLAVAAPASAHGYVSSPPSRQALCATGRIGCGEIKFEPQSVEGDKGLKSCHGGVDRFAELNDNSRDWPVSSVGSGKVTFTWVFTARHVTRNFKYFIGNTEVASFDGGMAQPAPVVNHEVDLSRFPGRQTLLAVWDIGDTPRAFYSCVDLNVGGGGGTAPSTPSEPPPPAGNPPPTPSEPSEPSGPSEEPSEPAAPAQPGTDAPAPKGEWSELVTYRTGDEVTHQGKRFRCRQGHTSLSTWEPSIWTLALWLPV